MKKLKQLKEQKNDLLNRLAALGNMRKGSVTKQVFKRKNKDGTSVIQGPYFLYSYKDRITGKTVSRRLSSVAEADIYKGEIQEFRKFENIFTELAEINQKICEEKHPSEKKTGKRIPSKNSQKA